MARLDGWGGSNDEAGRGQQERKERENYKCKVKNKQKISISWKYNGMYLEEIFSFELYEGCT